MTLCADGHRREIDAACTETAEYLRRLAFDLLLFTADVRQHVVENIQRRNAGITSARKRLQRCRHRRFNAKRHVQRRKRESEHDRRAVWIRNDESAARVFAPLALEQAEVLVIHFGNQQWHVLIHAKRRRVADYGVTGRRKTCLSLACNLARQTRKDEIAIDWRRPRLHR